MSSLTFDGDCGDCPDRSEQLFSIGIQPFFYSNRLKLSVHSYQFKFLIKINWMMKRSVSFFQILKSKKKYLKLRKQIFNEIYVQILKGFDSKLEKILGIEFPNRGLLKLTSIDINFD